MGPLVSILIPTYARAHYVREAVCSALAQNYQNIEVIVLDDASPDDTASVIQHFRLETRLRYVRHTRNLGITGNWRCGIGVARGEFFCLLHDDDTIEPEFISALLEPLQADDTLALAFCDQSLMDRHGHPLASDSVSARFRRDILPVGPLGGEAFARAVLLDFSIPVGATIFRRSSVKTEFLDERAKGSIDYWLLYRIFIENWGAYYINRRLMNYRIHDEGMSTKSALYMAEGHLFRYNAILGNPQFSSLHSQVKTQRCQTLTDCGINLAQAGRRVEARKALWNVLRDKPSSRAMLAFLLACGGPLGSWIIAQLRFK